MVDKIGNPGDVSNPITWKEKGNEFFNQGEYQKAIECFIHAIELDPNYLDAWNNLGYTLLKMGKIKEAKSINQKIKEIKSKSIESIPPSESKVGSSVKEPLNTLYSPNAEEMQKNYENGVITHAEYEQYLKDHGGASSPKPLKKIDYSPMVGYFVITILFLSVILFLGLMFTSIFVLDQDIQFTQSNPESIINDYFAAWDSCDADKMYSLLSADAQSVNKKDTIHNTCSSFRMRGVSIEQWEVNKVSIDKDIARVNVLITQNVVGFLKTDNIQFILVNETNRWRIATPLYGNSAILISEINKVYEKIWNRLPTDNELESIQNEIEKGMNQDQIYQYILDLKKQCTIIGNWTRGSDIYYRVYPNHQIEFEYPYHPTWTGNWVQRTEKTYQFYWSESPSPGEPKYVDDVTLSPDCQSISIANNYGDHLGATKVT